MGSHLTLDIHGTWDVSRSKRGAAKGRRPSSASIGRSQRGRVNG